MRAVSLCEPLTWDSEHFGFPVAKVRDKSLSWADAREVGSWARREGVRCVYYLAASDDFASITAARGAGFRFVGVRSTLECILRPSRSERQGCDLDAEIGFFRPEEVAALGGLARLIHRNTRFFRDSHFPRDRSRELYARWIEGDCLGAADAVLVARADGAPVGYVSCRLSEGDSGRIGLLGVGRAARGCGAGRRLLKSALSWFEAKQRRRVVVVTQGDNQAAVRLYLGGGFRVRSIETWWHLWPLVADSPAASE